MWWALRTLQKYSTLDTNQIRWNKWVDELAEKHEAHFKERKRLSEERRSNTNRQLFCCLFTTRGPQIEYSLTKTFHETHRELTRKAMDPVRLLAVLADFPGRNSLLVCSQ
jgi:hypothetical protein